MTMKKSLCGAVTAQDLELFGAGTHHNWNCWDKVAPGAVPILVPAHYKFDRWRIGDRLNNDPYQTIIYGNELQTDQDGFIDDPEGAANAQVYMMQDVSARFPDHRVVFGGFMFSHAVPGYLPLAGYTGKNTKAGPEYWRRYWNVAAPYLQGLGERLVGVHAHFYYRSFEEGEYYDPAWLPQMLTEFQSFWRERLNLSQVKLWVTEFGDLHYNGAYTLDVLRDGCEVFELSLWTYRYFWFLVKANTSTGNAQYALKHGDKLTNAGQEYRAVQPKVLTPSSMLDESWVNALVSQIEQAKDKALAETGWTNDKLARVVRQLTKQATKPHIEA